MSEPSGHGRDWPAPLERARSEKREDVPGLQAAFYAAVVREVRRQRRYWAGLTRSRSTTDWAHEVYLDKGLHETMARAKDGDYARGALTARVRQMIVDFRRHRSAKKRGGDLKRLEAPLDLPAKSSPSVEDRWDVEMAMGLLEKESPSTAEVLRARYWEGLTVEEVARQMGTGKTMVEARLRSGWAFLRERLGAATALGEKARPS